MKLSDQPLWLLEAQMVFENEGYLQRDAAKEAARTLATELDGAGLTGLWEPVPDQAARRQIREWDQHAEEPGH